MVTGFEIDELEAKKLLYSATLRLAQAVEALAVAIGRLEEKIDKK